MDRCPLCSGYRQRLLHLLKVVGSALCTSLIRPLLYRCAAVHPWPVVRAPTSAVNDDRRGGVTVRPADQLVGVVVLVERDQLCYLWDLAPDLVRGLLGPDRVAR